MLNESILIQWLEKNLGYRFNELELSHEEILNNIKSDSLITYSKFFPYQYKITLSDEDLVPGTSNAYYLNCPLEIININRLIHNDYIFSDTNPLTRTDVFGDPFTKQLANDMYSMGKNPITFDFDYPNVITIYPALIKVQGTLVICNTVHPSHFGTIPANMREQFLQLCLYDTKIVLYSLRSRFSALNTPYGSIELNIDDLREASDKKDNLLEIWRRLFAKSAKRKKLFII